MSSINRFAGYVAVLAVALVVALALLLSPSQTHEVEAAVGTMAIASATISADATQTVTVTDGSDVGAATDFIVGSINSASTGTAKFTSGGGQSLVCFNGATCDTDGAANTTIIFKLTGTGGAGAVIIDVQLTDGVDGFVNSGTDGSSKSIGWVQTAPAASVVVYTTSTGIPKTAVAGTASTAAVISAKVMTSTGAGVIAGTVVTLQAVGVGLFQDTITAAEVTHASAGGGAYDGGAAGVSGCSAGEGLQSCTAATEAVDDGQAATGEPAGTGIASVHFQGAGVAGTTTITARVGVAGPSGSVTINVYGAASSISLARTGTGAAVGGGVGTTFLRNTAASTPGWIIVSVTDSSGIPVVGFVPTFAVTSPTVLLGPVVLAGTASGTIPSCAAGTGARGTCSIRVTPSTTQGVNSVHVGNGSAALATVKASIDFTLVGAAKSSSFTAPPTTVAPLSTTLITYNVLDAEGDPAPDGTTVTFVATGTGALLAATTTSGGNSTVSLLAGSAGEIQIVAVVTGTTNVGITVSVATAAVADGSTGTGGLVGTLPNAVFGLVTYGGTIAGLDALLVADCGGNPIFGTGTSGFVGYFPTATVAAANAAFTDLFPSGIPDGTPLLGGNCAS